MLAGLGAAPAWADSFPSRPLRLLVPFAPGGPTDLMARAIAKVMAETMGEPVVVDNRPGGGGVIGFNELVRSPADGYTLILSSILAVTNPALMPGYPFDTLRDFQPLTVVGTVPHVVVVRADSPVHTLPELVEQAKLRPQAFSYGSSGQGTSAHLGAALFAQRAGLQVTHVPYRGAGPALQGLLGGQVGFMFLDMSSALAQLRAGKLRALAVAPARRFPGLPDVPTVAEQGFPGFDVHGWYGLLLRAGTPPAVVQRLYTEVQHALATKEVRDTFLAQGIDPGGMPPAEYTAIVRKDLDDWQKTIRQLNIHLE